MEKIKVLYIDNLQPCLYAFNAYFRTLKKYEIHLCFNTREAIQTLMDFPMDVVIIDQQTPFQVGIEFLEDVPPIFYEPVKIVVTAHRDVSLVEKALEDGAIYAYFNKPYNLDKIKDTIETAYETLKEKGEI